MANRACEERRKSISRKNLCHLFITLWFCLDDSAERNIERRQRQLHQRLEVGEKAEWNETQASPRGNWIRFVHTMKRTSIVYRWEKAILHGRIATLQRRMEAVLKLPDSMQSTAVLDLDHVYNIGCPTIKYAKAGNWPTFIFLFAVLWPNDKR